MHRRFRYRRRIRNAPKSGWTVYSMGLVIKVFIGVNLWGLLKCGMASITGLRPTLRVCEEDYRQLQQPCAEIPAVGMLGNYKLTP